MRPEAVLVASAGGVLTSSGGVTCSLRGRGGESGALAEPDPAAPDPSVAAEAALFADLSSLDFEHATDPTTRNKRVIPRISNANIRQGPRVRQSGTPPDRGHACANASRVRLRTPRSSTTTLSSIRMPPNGRSSAI